MRNRIIAAPTVEVYRRRIESLEREVAEVMREEREERSLRKAEQEATKVRILYPAAPHCCTTVCQTRGVIPGMCAGHQHD